ncbi:MAG TPA: YkgJ family cysteine cluster protein [Candidatus Binatia bacterium]|nr:YkgJ family cysteine cluster protein [Candidatus Binatia bacterium]
MATRDWQTLLRFHCTGCGNCCKGTQVMITDADVRRIADGTGRPVGELVQFARPGEILLDKRSPWWVRFESTRAVMTLRWTDERCAFLDADERCAIYEHRPVTCRDFPFNVTLSATGAVERLSLSNVVTCEHTWDGSHTRRELARTRQWNDRQADAYIRRVERWNRRRDLARTPDAFLQFLGLE